MSVQLSTTAHEALRLLAASGRPEDSEHHLKRDVGEALGLVVFDESSVERGVDEEIEELRRFDEADEAFEPEFQRAMEELAALGLVVRRPAVPGQSPHARLASQKPELKTSVEDLLEQGPSAPPLERDPRARLSALAI